MSTDKITEAWKAKCNTHTQKLLLVALADNANDHGFCWPSISALAKKCSLSKRGVELNISNLVKLGLIRVQARQGRSNYYWVLDPIGGLDSGTPERDAPPNGMHPPPNRVRPNHQRTVKVKNKEAFPIPPSLQTPAFERAWADWQEDRHAKRKPLTARAAELQFEKLEVWGPAKAVQAIHNSIANGWQGLFEPKEEKTYANKNSERPNPRNFGVDLEGQTDLVAAKIKRDEEKRAAERAAKQAARDKLAAEMAGAGDNAPEDPGDG